MKSPGDAMRKARAQSRKVLAKSKGLADVKAGKKTGTMSNVDKNTANWFK
jgi:hypothetical protein